MSKIKARVLAAFPDGGAFIAVGSIAMAAEATIGALETAGLVDPHPDAVAYAETQGGKVVDISGGELDQSVQSRIDESKEKPKVVKKLSQKQADAAIGKMSAAEKKAFETSGLDIDAWLAQEADQIVALVAAAQKSLDDAAEIEVMGEHEKAAFTKKAVDLDAWKALPEDERNALIEAEKPAE